MDVTLSLKPEVEQGLLARARARGLSLDEYLQEIVAREVSLPAAEELSARKSFDNLSELLLNSPFAGANLDLERYQDYPRATELG